MSAVLFALLASVCWGFSDFIGGLRTRSLHVVTVLASSAPVGLVVVGTVVLIRGDGPPGGKFWLWSMLAGVAGTAGIAGFYKALAVGRMGVVAPITAAAPVIPVIIGVARGERPTALQYAGMALALVGIVAAARELDQAATQRRVAAGVGYAVVAFTTFGLTQFFLAEASADDPYWGTLGLRLFFVGIVVTVFAAARPPLAPRNVVPSLVALGLLDVCATLSFAIATSRGLLSVVAVLASFYPVVVIVLARVLLHERLHRVQLAGALVALCGAALISAG